MPPVELFVAEGGLLRDGDRRGTRSTGILSQNAAVTSGTFRQSGRNWEITGIAGSSWLALDRHLARGDAGVPAFREGVVVEVALLQHAGSAIFRELDGRASTLTPSYLTVRLAEE
jgi:hypothetical protein